MNLHYQDYSQLSQISPIDLAYLQHDARLKEFYQYEPKPENISQLLDARKKYPVDRRLLFEVLKKQYEDDGLPLPGIAGKLLDNHTFTITTAHQPTLLTGPLFHIYKITSIINLSQQLNSKYPDHVFIPVFVLSGEDHDFAEVNHLHLFGRKIEWSHQAGGPVARMSIDNINDVLETVYGLFTNSPFGKEINNILRKCRDQAKNYGHFHKILLHSLFERHGLVILNPDNRALKKSFVPLMEKEIRDRFSYSTVPPVQSQLETAGFKPQAYCREINLFHMTDQSRERLDPDHIDIDATVKELHEYPERFSPNVILRPLYQEFILPNLIYIGGGGEIAYWLDRKNQFEEAGIHYPMLVRRNSLLQIDSATTSQLDKIDIPWIELSHDIHAIIKTYLLKHSEADLHYDQELELIKKAYSTLALKAEKLDPTLAKAILAEETKQVKQFENLGSRLIRTEKLHQETLINKIQKLKDRLFPGGGLQERHENFLAYYASLGPQWIDEMVRICDPFTEKFIVVEQVPVAEQAP